MREHDDWKKKQRREEETPTTRARQLRRLQEHDGRRMKIVTQRKAGTK